MKLKLLNTLPLELCNKLSTFDCLDDIKLQTSISLIMAVRGTILLSLRFLLLILIDSGMQLSFQMWTNQMQETLSSKKNGDLAFRHKDFRAAIDCYTQVRNVLFPFKTSCFNIHAAGN